MKLERINYKIDLSWVKGKAREVISEAVQKKAFSLGFSWLSGGSSIQHTLSPYLYFYFSLMDMSCSEDKIYFNESHRTEVSVNNWLNCDGFKESVKSPDTEHESGVDFDFDKWKLGKTIKYNGKIYLICKKTVFCDGCAFRSDSCPSWAEGCSEHHFIYKRVE